MSQLYFMEIGSLLNSCAFDEMFLSLPEERKTRLLKYRFEMDRMTAVYSDILVRCLICMNSAAKNSDLEIRRSPAGKPYLASGPRFEFNASHTRNAVAAALSDIPVGVDIERIRNVNPAVAKRVFSDKELSILDAAGDDWSIRFLEIWTKKEAVLKCRGTGLEDIAAVDTAGALPGEELTTVRDGSYIISVCSAKKFDDSSFVKITETDLIELWRDYVR